MKDWKYILYVVVAIGLFIMLKLISPKEYDWRVTYEPEDKNPYGGYALSQLLPAVFKGRIHRSYQTLYEIKDSLRNEGNLLIIATNFNCDAPDTKALLDFVAGGGTAFVSAQDFYGKLSDTLGVQTRDYLFLDHDWASRRDTTYLRFVNASFDTSRTFAFRKDNIYNFFSKFDTTRTTVITRNDQNRPVTIQVKWGQGSLILNSTPMVFTNIYLLNGDNHEFISGMLSYLPDEDIQWTQFYQVGRLESYTPLRFVLRTEPLKWAYSITMVALLMFMIFEMKRKQRIIPVIKPLQNTSLEFISTIGNLYYENKDHKNIAEKKILFMLEYIRFHYQLNTRTLDDNFISTLSMKSGKAHDDVAALFRTVNNIRSQKRIDAAELVRLNELIEKFYS